MVDIASRVWNHKWKIDPIVRSLIDTDFYKLLMCQSVFRNKPETQVVFSLINRSKPCPAGQADRRGRTARTAGPHSFAVFELAAKAPGCAATRFTASARCSARTSWSGSRACACRPIILERKGDQYELTFRRVMARGHAMGDTRAGRSDGAAQPRGAEPYGPVRTAGAVCARHDPLSGKRSNASRQIPDSCRIADFGTRRRHSFLWQDWCVQAMTGRVGRAPLRGPRTA